MERQVLPGQKATRALRGKEVNPDRKVKLARQGRKANLGPQDPREMLALPDPKESRVQQAHRVQLVLLAQPGPL